MVRFVAVLYLAAAACGLPPAIDFRGVGVGVVEVVTAGAVDAGTDRDDAGTGVLNDAGWPFDAGPSADAGSPVDAGSGSPGCGSAAFGGIQNIEVMISGTLRRFLLIIPDNYDAQRRYPLVFGFHGQGWTMDGFRQASLPLIDASAQGAIFVFPQGLVTAGRSGWDVTSANSSDLALVDTLRTVLPNRLCIDEQRLFAFGRSMGGYFTNTLSCTRGHFFRGVAVMMGGGPFLSCTTTPTAWWGTHNEDDATVPFSAGTQSRDFWRIYNGCSNSTQPAGSGSCVSFTGCQAPVQWCPFMSGNHVPAPSSNQAIWAFFQSLR